MLPNKQNNEETYNYASEMEKQEQCRLLQERNIAKVRDEKVGRKMLGSMLVLLGVMAIGGVLGPFLLPIIFPILAIKALSTLIILGVMMGEMIGAILVFALIAIDAYQKYRDRTNSTPRGYEAPVHHVVGKDHFGPDVTFSPKNKALLSPMSPIQEPEAPAEETQYGVWYTVCHAFDRETTKAGSAAPNPKDKPRF